MANLAILYNSRQKFVKFISYDGSYPNLCSGTLELEYQGKKYKMHHILISGGSVWFDEYGNEGLDYDEWTIDSSYLPDELKAQKDLIKDLVNKNVPYGCCGGCI